MNRKTYIIALLLCTAVIFGGISYAGGGGMGGGSGAGMGSSMGEGHGMMGYGQNYSNSRREQPRTNQNYQYEKKETQSIREEIKVKRQELSDLYRSEKPNKEIIDHKIAELDELEAKLDEKLSDDK